MHRTSQHKKRKEKEEVLEASFEPSPWVPVAKEITFCGKKQVGMQR